MFKSSYLLLKFLDMCLVPLKTKIMDNRQNCYSTDYQQRKPIYQPNQEKLNLDYQQITVDKNNLSEKKHPFIARIWAECVSDNHHKQDVCNVKNNNR